MDNKLTKSLKSYINDKAELIVQAFASIGDAQLKKMLPDVLASMKLDDLKAECFIELLGMSKQRILYTLDGKELEESSEDESLILSSDDSSEKPPPIKTKSVVKKITPTDNSKQGSFRKLFPDESEERDKVKKTKKDSSSPISKKRTDGGKDSSKKKKTVDSDNSKGSKKSKKKEKDAKRDKSDRNDSSDTSPEKNIDKHSDKKKKKIRNKEKPTKSDKGDSKSKKQNDGSNEKEEKTNKSKKVSKEQSKKTTVSPKTVPDKEVQEVQSTSSAPTGSFVNLDFALPDPALESRRKEGQSLLELLELEMRAKAIRALLEREESKGRKIETIDLVEDDDDPDAVIVVQDTLPQVDLTVDDEDDKGSEKCEGDRSEGAAGGPAAEEKECSSSASEITKSATEDLPEEMMDTDPDCEESPQEGPSNLSDLLNRDKTWIQRWLSSDKVKRVLATSKAVSNLRKRLKVIHSKPELSLNPKESNQETEQMISEIEGTTQQYQSLNNNKGEEKINDSNQLSSTTSESAECKTIQTLSVKEKQSESILVKSSKSPTESKQCDSQIEESILEVNERMVNNNDMEIDPESREDNG